MVPRIVLTVLAATGLPLCARAFDSVVVFNELQYHPAPGGTEWIELRNLHAVDVNLGRWSITGGVDFTFPEGTTIPGHGFLVVAANPAEVPGSLGPFAGSLSNSGERLRLRNQTGRIMDELEYEDSGDWPAGPDGSGATLARIRPGAHEGAAFWRTSVQIGGTPGAENFPDGLPPPSLVINEISPGGDPGFLVELCNHGPSAVSTAGWILRTDAGAPLPLPEVSVPPGGFVTTDPLDPGMIPFDGTRLFLVAPDGSTLADARAVTGSLRGLTADGRWDHPTTPTPGAANIVEVTDAIVINEIFYNQIDDGPVQWVELFNRSGAAVDLTGWRIAEGIDFLLPAGTSIAAGGYLVIANDPAAFAAAYPGVPALGPWTGNLSGKGETIRLRDQNDNVVDEVRYADGGRWPGWADGGGSSLELIDPRADNSLPEAWAASDESGRSEWHTVSYSGRGTHGRSGDLAIWHEFVMGLLDAGECLIDDISVIESPGAEGERELIQNGTFSDGTADKWRIIGTHSGQVVDDPDSPGNKVLLLSASAATEHMHNHACTSLKAGDTFVNISTSREYRISFRARWLRGSPRLHTRLYFNRLARQTILPHPAAGGTPGAPNSRRVENAGPGFTFLRHDPAVPAPTAPVTVTAGITDPDGVTEVSLLTSVDGGEFTTTPMIAGPDGTWTATVPGKPASTQVQFYLEAVDSAGAVSRFPAAGPDSRAMILWDDGRARPVLASGRRPHQFRIVMPREDTTDMYRLENVMSNHYRPCTVIFDEREVYYHAAVRLKSSEHGRFAGNRVGYNVRFGRDEPFMGAHLTVSLDRSGNRGTGGIDGNNINSQREILLKAVSNAAGGIHASEDDIVRLLPPVTASGPGIAFTGTNATGSALLSKARFDDEYLDGIFPDGGSASVFKYELQYPLSQTINPETRRIDSTPQREHPKVPQAAGGVVGVPVTSLGNDKELYRWHWLIRNGRSRDDYAPLMAAVTAVGRSGSSAAFRTETEATLDVNTWLRSCIPGILFSATDNYTASGAQHNALLVFPPGGKGVLIPWDLDYLAQDSPTASLTGGGDLSKFLSNPVNRRLYYGHLLDILEKAFHPEFLTKWARHYSEFDTDDMTTSLTFLTRRASYALDVVYGRNGRTAPVPQVEFALHSTEPVVVSTSVAEITGTGWINVDTIRTNGVPLPVVWTAANQWSVQLPVALGTHPYVLEAYDRNGTSLGSVTVTVTSTSELTPAGPGSLAISELNYNPPGPDDLEEFVELLNVSPGTLDLTGVTFTDGIVYTFPPGVTVPPGGRILVIRDQAAFAAAYPDAGPVAPGVYTGALNNAGEEIALATPQGVEILRISYGSDIPGTDGDGYTLVRGPDGGWRAGSTPGGTPGEPDSRSFPGTDPFADADGDGLCALLEYAAGTSDTEFTPLDSILKVTPQADGTVAVSVLLLPDVGDVVVVLESAESPAGEWTALPGLTGTLEGTRKFVRVRTSLR